MSHYGTFEACRSNRREFNILAPDTGPGPALRRRIWNRPHRHKIGRAMRVSVRIGRSPVHLATPEKGQLADPRSPHSPVKTFERRVAGRISEPPSAGPARASINLRKSPLKQDGLQGPPRQRRENSELTPVPAAESGRAHRPWWRLR